MACPVCVHPQRDEIDSHVALLSLRQLERQYHVSRSSLGRHRQHGQGTLDRRPGQASPEPGAPGEPGARAPVRHPLEQPTPPASLVNAHVHQALRRLAADLPTSQPYLHDPRQAVAAVVELLLQVVTDDTPPVRP